MSYIVKCFQRLITDNNETVLYLHTFNVCECYAHCAELCNLG